MKTNSTRTIVMTGMMVALVTVGTFINIPTPGNIGGLVHLGTLITFAIAIKYGPKYGAIAGGIGAMITKREEFVYISEPYKGYPAQKAGLMAGDKISEIKNKEKRLNHSKDSAQVIQ